MFAHAQRWSASVLLSPPHKATCLPRALCSLGQHEALRKASDSVLAFLSDLYVLAAPKRARAARTRVEVLQAYGIAAFNKKTARTAAMKAFPPPPVELHSGVDICRGDKPLPERDGSPGRFGICDTWTQQRGFSAIMRCGLSPPTCRGHFCSGAHDAAIWQTLQLCLRGVAVADFQGTRHMANHGNLSGCPRSPWLDFCHSQCTCRFVDAQLVLRARSPAFADACT